MYCCPTKAKPAATRQLYQYLVLPGPRPACVGNFLAPLNRVDEAMKFLDGWADPLRQDGWSSNSDNATTPPKDEQT